MEEDRMIILIKYFYVQYATHQRKAWVDFYCMTYYTYLLLHATLIGLISQLFDIDNSFLLELPLTALLATLE